MLKLTLFLSLLFNLSSLQIFTIIGSVRDTTGRSVPGVRVSVMDENFQPIRTIFVDSNGQFFVRGLSPGRYQFKVETTGTPYQEQSSGWIELQSLRIRSGGSETQPLDFVLKFKPNKDAARSKAPIFVQDVPVPARLEFERGAKNLQENKSGPGLAALRKAIQLYPDYFDALEMLGVEQVKNGAYAEAIPLLTRAVTINPRSAKSFYSLGVAHLRLNQFKDAIECLTKAAEFDAANANTPMMLGIAFGNNQQLAESETAFKQALRLGGLAMADAHFYLAGIYDKQHKYREAAMELELYLKEAKNLKDTGKVKEMIRKMREKAKEKPSS